MLQWHHMHVLASECKCSLPYYSFPAFFDCGLRDVLYIAHVLVNIHESRTKAIPYTSEQRNVVCNKMWWVQSPIPIRFMPAF